VEWVAVFTLDELAATGLRSAQPELYQATAGSNVTLAEPDFVLSATLVAVTVAVCSEDVAGAVYNPG
jgi:hypothetical protein